VSVSEPALARFLAGVGRGAKVLGVDLPLLVENRYEDPAEVGRDRLVNAAAGHVLAGGAAVVVDLGSAVTADAVDADGAFLGGAIAPGLPAFRAGLRAAAPALPPIPEGEPPNGIPRSTADALRAGAVRGLAGLADRLVADARAGLVTGEEPAPALLTGGDAALVSRHMSTRTRLCPDLTLRGVAILRRRAKEGRP
jgi:type III pantothenate kinase